MLPTIYSGLSEDDRFIGKLLAAQNFMCNIQTEVTKLIQDYMKIRQKDRKRKQKQRKNPVKPPQQQHNTTPKIGIYDFDNSNFRAYSQWFLAIIFFDRSNISNLKLSLLI